MLSKFNTAIFILFMLCAPAMAVAPHPQKPIQVEADHMLSTQKDNSVFFSGRVVARQGILTIHADELTVYYASGTAKTAAQQQGKTNDSREIKNMKAHGNVKIVQKNWVATGDNAEYFEKERKVVIIGHTKVWQDNNMVTGDRFVLWLDEGKSIVEHDQKKGERVKAFFYPNK